MKTPTKIAILGSDPFVIESLGREEQLFTIDCFSEPKLEELSSYELVLVHHCPPLQNGIELLFELKSLGLEKPIILFGQTHDNHDIVEAFRCGAADFLLHLDTEVIQDCLSKFSGVKSNSEKKKSLWKKLMPCWLATREASPSQIGIVAAPCRRLYHAQESKETHRSDKKSHFISVQFFGKAAVFIDGRTVEIRGTKPLSLLLYMMLHAGRPIHKEKLMDLFWKDYSPSAARNNLNVAIHAIRKAVKRIASDLELICFVDDAYLVNPALVLSSDIMLFDQYWKDGMKSLKNEADEEGVNAFKKAFAIYRGEFMANFPYESWPQLYKEKYAERWLVVCFQLIKYCMQHRRFHQSIEIARRMLEVDTCIETAHRTIIQSYMALGMRTQALRQFKKCVESLKAELGIAPGKELRQLYEQLISH